LALQQASTAQVILTSIADGVVTLDRSGAITGLNPAAAEIMGLDPDQAMGRPYGEVFFGLAENDDFNQLLLDLVAGQETRSYAEVPFHREDGQVRHLALTTSLLSDHRQGRLGATLVFMDITETHALRRERDRLARELEAKHKELTEAYLELEEQNQSLRDSRRRGFWVKLMAGLLALGLVGGLLWWVWQRDQGPARPMAAAEQDGEGQSLRGFTARTGLLRRTVSCRGFIEPLVTVTVSAQVSGRVERRLAELGQRVEQGEVLLRLSRDEVEPKVRAAEAALLKARQQMAEIQSWARRPEFKQAERRLELAELELKRKKDRLTESQRLYEEGIVPLDELDNARADLRRVQADVAEAEERLMTVRERGSEDRLRVARLELLNAEAALAESREKLAHTVVRSPAAGVVMRPPGKQDDKSARIPELGDKVSEGQALFTVGAERPLGVRATVDEVAVRRVRPGQRALVSGPALGERALEGRVRSVAPQASREGQLPVFPVRIALEDLAPERARLLRLGMSASVRIVVREEKDAVLVPVVAVKRRGGGEAVRVPGPEGPVWRQVTTGLSDAEFIQVTEGLAAGQKVLY
jgi:PAS domain S-box-containing protein